MALNKVVMLLFVAMIGDPMNCLQQVEVEGSSSCILEQLGQADQTLMQQTEELTTQMQQLTVEGQQLNSTANQLKSSNGQLASDLDELDTEIQQLSARIDNIEGSNPKNIKSAFSAYMTIGYFEPNNSTKIVVPMNGVQLNLNDDYNSQTSTYTCPVSGVYYFNYAVYSAAVKTSTDDRVYAFLSLNDDDLNDAYCKTDTTVNIYCQATNGATVHCSKGGRVQIKTSSKSGKNQIYGKSNYKRTNFSGHLLYADNADK